MHRITGFAVIVMAMLATPSVAHETVACTAGCASVQEKATCMSSNVSTAQCGGSIVLAGRVDDCIGGCENIYGSQGKRAKECMRQCRTRR
jgi:hypothetical protein